MAATESDSAAEADFTPPSEVEALDYLFFRAEQDPRSRQDILGIEILDRTPDWKQLVATFDRASRVVRRMRQKIVAPIVPLGTPKWVVDPDFDLGFHVRRAAAPAPGTMREVLDMAVPMLEAPLDTARPLWEVTLIEGLADGRAALLTKMSHAVTDGVGGIQLETQIYDAQRDQLAQPLPPAPAPDGVSPEKLTINAFSRMPAWWLSITGRSAWGLARIGARTVRAPMNALPDAVHYVQSMQRVVLGPPSEPSPLLAGRSLASRIEVLDVPLDALRLAAKAVGCSINDAYMAAVCAVMRRYHEELGVPVETLQIVFPISFRTKADQAGSNRIGSGRLLLPVAEKDPVERMRIIHHRAVAARAEPAIHLMSAIAPVLSRLPSMPGLTSRAFGGVALELSNLPGDPRVKYIAGARSEGMYGVGPRTGVPATVVMLSQQGTAFIAVRYDPAAITDFDLFARSLREGFAEVTAAGAKR